MIGTSEVGLYSMTFNHNNLPRRVVLIDTPGFDDTNRSDSDVLQDITFILSQTYEQGIKLTGIIYLHRITDVRMSGSALKNLTIFKKLCGENFYTHVVLATSMWGNLAGDSSGYDTGVAREKELVETKNWWGLMCNRGSKIFRYGGDRESAMSIISYLIALGSAATLDIQREMVDEKKVLADTSAGQEVQKELQEQQRKHEKEKSELIAAREEALKDKDHELAEELLKERQESNKKLLAMERAKQELRLDFQRLKKDKEAHYAKMLREQEKQWEAKLREDQDRWEQKSREDKRALEHLAHESKEERQRWENQLLEGRRAMAAKDEQSREERKVLEQWIAESQRAQRIRDSERDSEVTRLRGSLEELQATSNSKVTQPHGKLEEFQPASRKAPEVVTKSGTGAKSLSRVRSVSSSLRYERSVSYQDSPPGSPAFDDSPPEKPDNDESPPSSPVYNGFDEEDGDYDNDEEDGDYDNDEEDGDYDNDEVDGDYDDDDDVEEADSRSDGGSPRKSPVPALGILAVLAGAVTMNPFLVAAGAGASMSGY